MARTRFGRRGGLIAGMLVLAAGASVSLADLPGVLDRVPEGATVVIAVRDMKGATEEMKSLLRTLNIPMEQDENGQNPFEAAEKFLSLPGIKNGSMAMIALPDEHGEFVKDRGVALVPVSDFAALTGGVHATQDGNVWSMEMDGKTVYAASADGYAVMGDNKELVSAFQAKGGNTDRIARSLGPVGRRIGDSADAFVIINTQAFRSKMEERAKEMIPDAAAMEEAGPAAEQMKAMAQVSRAVLGAFARDASVSIVGVNLSDKGITLDLASQFKEGSEAAGLLSAPGDAAKLLAHVPKMDFLLAGAIDTSGPGMRQLLKLAGQLKPNQDGAPGMFDSMFKASDKVDGKAFVMGASPGGLTGGLFTNTTAYVATKDPKGYVEETRKGMNELDGKTVNGMTFKLTYKPEAVDVAGAKADSWTMAMQPDPNNTNAMQMTMGMNMIFGPGGMQGMMIPAASGVVTTMSKNAELATKAVEAADKGEGLSTDPLVRQSREGLPANRVMELYLGTRSILEAANQMIGMFMGGAPEIEVPKDVAPIALAMTAEGGGAGLHAHIPISSAKAIAAFAKAMQGEGDEEAPAPQPMQDDSKPPKF